MASGKAYLVAAASSLLLLSAFISGAESASCCLSYTSRRLSCRRILGYSIQTITGSCDINAIIFHVPGRFVCADPGTWRTRMGRKCVDERRKRIPQVITEVVSHRVTSSQVKDPSSSTSA